MQRSLLERFIENIITKHVNVLMFSYYFPPQYSGSALQAINLSMKLREKGVNVAFLTVNHDEISEIDEVEGFRVFRTREGKGKYGESLLWKNMWNFLIKRRSEFDIIHSHGAYLRNSFVGPLSKLLGKKSLIKVSLAGDDLYGLGKGKSGWLHKKFITMVDRYISISKGITKELRKYGFPEERIKEIPNGVNTERFCPVSQGQKIALRRKFGFPEDDLMLLYVGVIDVRKNVRWLIELWDKLSHYYQGFLVVVGPMSREDRDMKLYNSLKEYEKKLRNRLFLIQYSDVVQDFYRMADIFVLPSTNEGMPNVVLEAMSSGIPCIANKVSGAEDIINGENGLLFDIQEPHTLFHCLMKLKDVAFRYAMGKKARDVITKYYSLDSVADQYLRLYEEVTMSQ